VWFGLAFPSLKGHLVFATVPVFVSFSFVVSVDCVLGGVSHRRCETLDVRCRLLVPHCDPGSWFTTGGVSGAFVVQGGSQILYRRNVW